jgi:Flp pilus assembly protein TadG
MVRSSSASDGTPDGGRPLVPQRRNIGGQSVVEFALLLPVLLALVGVGIDFARVYQTWTNLESATRDAAQYLATSNVDPTAADYTVPNATANATNDGKAKFVLDNETGSNFTRSNAATLGTCSGATFTTVTGSADTTLANGGTDRNPVQQVTVLSCIPFRPLFAYPYATTNGAWILQSSRVYSVIVGR